MFADTETAWRRVGRLCLVVLAAVGYVLGYFSTFDVLGRLQASLNVEGILAVLYIILLSAVALAFLAYRFFVADRKEKFANISPTLHAAVMRCKDLMTSLERQHPNAGGSLDPQRATDLLREARRQLRDVCDELAQIFAMLTSTHCRASIKVIIPEDDGQLYVVALARDNITTQAAPKFDDARRQQKMDPIAENADFLRLANNRVPSYVYACNDLRRREGLNWTSIRAYLMGRQYELYPRRWWEFKRALWILPYRSTVTVAIRSSPDSGNPDDPSVVGFLAVDSESRNVFHPRWDQHLCALVADSLFHPVNRLLELLPQDGTNHGVSPKRT